MTPKWSIFISVDPLVEKTMDAYGYCYQNPVKLTDPTGMSAESSELAPPTDYVDKNGNLLLHTEDGSNAVITVPDEKLDTFKSTVESTTAKGLNSRSWNFIMKKFLVGEWNQTRENIQSWYATPEARAAVSKFWQTGDYDYWAYAANEHTATFRKDILAWGLAISGGLIGIRANLLTMENSVAEAMTGNYVAMGEVSVPIKSTGLLNRLNSESPGNWVKVYEAGILNGKKIETHYFRNNATRQVFDVKTKYNHWHQSQFKKL